MARHSNMAHTGSDGSTPADRATRAGYRWRSVGENIAAGQTTPEAAVESWLKSPPHCANLMAPQFTEMGVAYSVDTASKAGIYWAQLLGTPPLAADPRSPRYRASFCIQPTIAATTGAGCSGIRAWLASAITTMVTRLPNSSLSSFVVSRGLKGSSAA